MRILAILVLLFGAALAGGGIYYASVYMELYKAGLQVSGPETQRIIVAKKQLSYGHRVNKDDLRWVEWPKDSVPGGAFTSIEALFGKEKDDNDPRIALRTIEAGEPLLTTKLSGFGTSTRLAAQLPEGKRAFTIGISDAGGGGFIGPGDRVDVILTKTEDGQLLSKVIMQDVPVIAVDRNLNKERSSGGGSRATIEVTRTQAQQLLLASRVGELLLMLRGVHETVSEEVDLVDTSAFNFRPDAPTADAPQFGVKVRVRRGTSLGTQQVEDSPEMLEQKRLELEEEQKRVAEELQRLEEQTKQTIN
ncbi:MAG TPA: Flp pilus assembly protein CpaB [Thermohalobaculum sp.]|nr:Flp pilus assembly protein CpaB [Thermohalobaculum sp.]